MADIVIAEFMDEAAVEDLRRDYDVVYDPGLVDRADDLLAAVAGCRALVVRNRTQVRGALLDAAPRLVALGRLGVGLDNIDMEACRARGIARLAGDRRQRPGGRRVRHRRPVDASARRLPRRRPGTGRGVATHGADGARGRRPPPRRGPRRCLYGCPCPRRRPPVYAPLSPRGRTARSGRPADPRHHHRPRPRRSACTRPGRWRCSRAAASRSTARWPRRCQRSWSPRPAPRT